LELLKHLPDDAERARQELSMQSVLGRSLLNVKGWAAPELEPVYTRARELCAQIRDPALAFITLYSQWLTRFWKLELDKALELADELLAAAEEAKDPAMLLVGNEERGVTLFEFGELGPATQHLEKALAVFDLRQSLPSYLKVRAGLVEVVRMNSLSFLYFCMWELGYPDRAWTRSREMLEVAQRSSVPHILAIAYLYAALHNLTGGNPTAAQKYAEEAMVRTEEMGLVSLSAFATSANGAALIAQGRYEEGIAGMREGISAIRASGAPPPAWTLFYLAFGFGKAGRPQEGLEVVEEGLASVAKTGEQLASPWLHHVKGELLLAQNPSNAAEVELCFRTAIEIARGQSARMTELRVTTSLARLLATQGRRDEARAMLADIYGWFNEGFDSTDLKDAKALLDELNA